MSYYATYTIPAHKSGDTFLGVEFTMTDSGGSAINIGGAVIELITSSPFSETLTTIAGGGLTITNGAAGEFKIDEQRIDWASGNYEYEIIFTFASGRKRTYITGFWEIVD
jgi:hypothetical protein